MNDDDDEVDTFVKVPETKPPASPIKKTVNFADFMDEIDNDAQRVDVEDQSASLIEEPNSVNTLGEILKGHN